MCTLIVFSRAFPDTPLLVAANRDEKLDRPAGPPAITTHRGMRILCPIDLEAGGTWLGLNAKGLFVGITNRFGQPRKPGVRSRGLLVLDALSLPSARESAEHVAALDPGSSNPFHLLLADREDAHLVFSDGERITHRVLEPGTHFVTERSFDAAPTAREPKIRELLAGLTRPAVAAGAINDSGQAFARPGLAADSARVPVAPDDGTLQALLSHHDPDGLEGICVHVPGLGYGTRSSTIIRAERGSSGMRMLHADRPPCEAPYKVVPLTEPLFAER